MKIKHYTFFTESHRIFLKYFLNTFPFESDIDLVVRYMPQECTTGEFESTGWNNTMSKKVNYIIDSLNELNDGDIFIHTDADVVFFKSYKTIILEELGDSDIAFQSDVGTACMGVFACRLNSNTKKFFNELKNILPNHVHDHAAANYLLQHSSYVRAKLFTYKIFNYGFFGKHYEGEEVTNIPKDLVLLHANFTTGIDNKIKLIKQFIN